jgi:DNA ligase-1
MLRQPASKYAHGRSHSLLKVGRREERGLRYSAPVPPGKLQTPPFSNQVKTFHDAEAVVIGHQAGKGRHVGRLGALELRMACGKTVCRRGLRLSCC